MTKPAKIDWDFGRGAPGNKPPTFDLEDDGESTSENEDLRTEVDEEIDDDLEGGGEGEGEGSEQSSIEEKLTGRQPQAQPQPQVQADTAAMVLQQIVSDPEISQILQARRNGKKVKVVSEEQDQPSVTIDPSSINLDLPDDYEDMKPTELARKIQMGILSQVDKLVKEQVKAVTGEVTSVKNYVAEQQKSTLKQQIEAARKKYSDFDNYRDEMISLSNQNPGLNVEELYLIARQRLGGGAPVAQPTQQAGKAPRGVASEKPNTSTARSARRPNRPEPSLSGRASFKQALNQALDKLQL